MIATKLKAVALAGGFSLIAAATSHATFGISLPDPTSSGTYAIGAAAAAGGGSILATLDTALVTPGGTPNGTLRSFVVNNGGTLDFYYQLVNTSAVDAFGAEEIFRLQLQHAFVPSTVLSVGQTTKALSGLSLAGYTDGTKAGQFADRGQGETGDLGFDFGPVVSPDPLNVSGGTRSDFLVVRTNLAAASPYTIANVQAYSGFGTTFAAAFAAIPEPSSVLFGLAIAAVAIKGRRTRKA